MRPVRRDTPYLVVSGLEATTYLDSQAWGPEYSYRVVARDACTDPMPQTLPNAGGDSPPETPPDTQPPSFAGVSDVEDIGACHARVHWDEATAIDTCSGIDHFVIFRDHGAAHVGETVVGTATASPYVDASPGNGVWTYVVRAVDRAGNEEHNMVFIEAAENSCADVYPRDARLHNDRNVNPRTTATQQVRIAWEPSPDEGGPYPVTYAILRGNLRQLRLGDYDYVLVHPAACGLTDHEYLMENQVDGVSYYYVVVAVSGDNATYGYDSAGTERREEDVCE